MKALSIVLAAVLLAGCTTPKLATPSGRPEVTFTGHSLEQVRSAVIAGAVGKGFAPIKTEGNDLAFEKEAGAALSILVSSGGSTAKKHLQVSLLPQGDGAVRALAAVYLQYTASFSPHSEELDGRARGQLQAWLESIKQDLH